MWTHLPLYSPKKSMESLNSSTLYISAFQTKISAFKIQTAKQIENASPRTLRIFHISTELEDEP